MSEKVSLQPAQSEMMMMVVSISPATCWCRSYGYGIGLLKDSYLVDPASSHMLVSKIKPCMSKYKPT